MQKKLIYQTLPFLMAGILGLVLGRLLFDNSSEVRELRAKLEELTHARSNESADGNRRIWKGGRASTSALPEDSSASSRDEDDELGLTSEEWESSKERFTRRREGDYFLDSEIPASKRATDRLIDEAVARTAPTEIAEYSGVFSELGIHPQVSGQLATHVTKIHKASREAEAAIQQLLEARTKYAERLNTLLSEEDFARYRQYEEAKPASREYQNLQNFLANQKNTSIDPKYEESIKSVIQEAKAYTDKTWHGPLDGLPEPGYGREMVMGQLEQHVNQIKERASDLMRKASEAGLPGEYKNLLAAYYLERIREYQGGVERIRIPPSPEHHPRPPGAPPPQ